MRLTVELPPEVVVCFLETEIDPMEDASHHERVQRACSGEMPADEAAEVVSQLMHEAERWANSEDWGEARSCLEQVITIEKCFDNDHASFLVDALVEVESVCERLDDPLAAEDAYLNAIMLLERCHGCDAEALVSPLRGLAFLYARLNRCDESLPLYEHIEQIAMPDFDELPLVLVEKASAQATVGQFRDAQQTLHQAANLFESSNSHETSEIVPPLTRIAEIHQQCGNHVEAVDTLENAVKRCRKAYGRKHWSVAKALLVLSDILISQKKYAAATPVLFRATDLYEDLHGPSSESIAICYHRIGEFYEEQRNWRNAELYYRRAICIAEREQYKQYSWFLRALTRVQRFRGHDEDADRNLAMEIGLKLAPNHQEHTEPSGDATHSHVEEDCSKNGCGWIRLLWNDLIKTFKLADLSIRIGYFSKDRISPEQLKCYLDKIAEWLRKHETTKSYPNEIIQIADVYIDDDMPAVAIYLIDYVLDQHRNGDIIFALTTKSLASALKLSGVAYLALEDIDNSKRRLSEALTVFRQVFGKRSTEVAYLASYLAHALERYDDREQARVLYGEAAEIWQEIAGEWHPRYAENMKFIQRLSANNNYDAVRNHSGGESHSQNMLPQNVLNHLLKQVEQDGNADETTQMVTAGSITPWTQITTIAITFVLTGILGTIGVPLILYLFLGWGIPWLLLIGVFVGVLLSTESSRAVMIYFERQDLAYSQNNLSRIPREVADMVAISTIVAVGIWGAVAWQPFFTTVLKWLNSHGLYIISGLIQSALVGSQLGRSIMFFLERNPVFGSSTFPRLRYNVTIFYFYVVYRQYDKVDKIAARNSVLLSIIMCNGFAAVSMWYLGPYLTVMNVGVNAALFGRIWGYFIGGFIAFLIAAQIIRAIVFGLSRLSVPIPRLFLGYAQLSNATLITPLNLGVYISDASASSTFSDPSGPTVPEMPDFHTRQYIAFGERQQRDDNPM